MNDTPEQNEASWLTSGDSAPAGEPFALFAAWLAEATKSEPNDPTAMALATVDAAGRPDVRMVLMKDYDPRGFVFYSNVESQKGQELTGNPNASLLFHWKSLRRQIRIRGVVETVTDAEADAYFASRPKQAQLGSWASKQSRTLESRFAFEQAIATYAARYALTSVPRPPQWIGWRVKPHAIEFWHDRQFRLHDRMEFFRDKPDASPDTPWRKKRMYP